MSEGGISARAETEGARRALGVLLLGIRDAGDAAIYDAIRAAEVSIRSTTLFKNQSGRLRKDFQTYRQNRYRAIYESRTPYAIFVESGTRAHLIRPKEGHGFEGPLKEGQSRRAIDDIGTHRVALRWFTNGSVHFARVVHHPGTLPRPFMREARDAAERQALATADRHLTLALNTFHR